MIWVKKILFTAAVACYCLPLFANKQPLRGNTNEQRIARTVAKQLPRTHISHSKIDKSMSEKLFQEYFVSLDPEKAFFLETDIAKFKSYENKLHDDLASGNLDFPFEVFELFINRVRERTQKVVKRLDESFDFEKDETLEIDRKKLKWLNSVEQLDDYWRKRAKNSLLTYQMLDEALEKKKSDDTLTAKERKELKERELFPARSPKERAKRLFETRLARYEDFDSEDVLEIYLSTLCKLYDIHSSYMAPKSVEDFNIQMRLSLQGIGATLRSDDHGFIKITKISSGGPADKSGLLKEGDRILGVAQEDGVFIDVIDMPLDRAVKLIRGTKGSKVTLSIIKGDKGLSSAPEIIEIIRDNVEIKESSAKSKIYELSYDALDPALRTVVSAAKINEAQKNKSKLKIGVIKIPSFYADFSASNRNINTAKTVTNDVLKLLPDLLKQNIDGLVVDLRNNGGGSLVEAIRLTGLFISEGPVVQIATSGADINVQSDKDRRQQYSGPLVVMVNKFSASASEIFAGAIQDYGRGIIVGDKKTHGKGTVQSVFDLDTLFNLPAIFKLPPAGTLKFTVQKFYRITGASTQLRGVTPDISYPAFTDYIESGEENLDNVLPWDEIKPAEFLTFDSKGLQINKLRKMSNKRLLANEEFQKLVEQINEYGLVANDKSISLNKKERQKKFLKANEFSEIIEKSLSEEDDDKVTSDSNMDLYLNEAISIIGDNILLNRGLLK